MSNLTDSIDDQLQVTLELIRKLVTWSEEAAPLLSKFIETLDDTINGDVARSFRDVRNKEKEINRLNSCQARMDLVVDAVKAGISEDVALQILFSVYPDKFVESDLTNQLTSIIEYATKVLTVRNSETVAMPFPFEVPDVDILRKKDEAADPSKDEVDPSNNDQVKDETAIE